MIWRIRSGVCPGCGFMMRNWPLGSNRWECMDPECDSEVIVTGEVIGEDKGSRPSQGNGHGLGCQGPPDPPAKMR